MIDCLTDKVENIMTFRDKSHKNIATGQRSPALRGSWFNRKDDSTKAFMDSIIEDVECNEMTKIDDTCCLQKLEIRE